MPENKQHFNMGSSYISYIKRPEEQSLILKISITLQLCFLNQQTYRNTHGYRLYSSRERERLSDILLRILKIHSNGKVTAISIQSGYINLRCFWFSTNKFCKWPLQKKYENYIRKISVIKTNRNFRHKNSNFDMRFCARIF